MVLQHNDIAKQRKEQNETHEVSISIIVMQKFTPLMAHIMEDMKKGKQIEGKRMKVAPLDMTRILPKLNEFFETDELGKGSTIDVNEVTKLQKELLRQVKPTHIPGVKPVERLWNLFQLYSMADRKSTRLNSSHLGSSYAVFCLKKKKKQKGIQNNVKFVMVISKESDNCLMVT